MLKLERKDSKIEFKDVSTSSEGNIRRIYFHGAEGSVLFELKRSKLGGYTHGFIHIKSNDTELRHRLGRLELELMRRELMEGREHLLAIGDVLVRISPEALGYLFPRETYTLFTRLLFRAWELGRKIRELGGNR